MAKTCPTIGCDNVLAVPEVMNALSRKDNETYICSPCGVREAFEDAGLVEKTPH